MKSCEASCISVDVAKTPEIQYSADDHLRWTRRFKLVVRGRGELVVLVVSKARCLWCMLTGFRGRCHKKWPRVVVTACDCKGHLPVLESMELM